MRKTLPSRLVVPAALLATALAATACLDDTTASAPVSRPANAATARIGPAYALAAQPDWRTLETAAGPTAGRVQLAQATPPQPGRSVVTTLNTNDADAAAQPAVTGRATSIMLNSRRVTAVQAKPPVVLSLTQPAAEPIALPPPPADPNPIAAAADAPIDAEAPASDAIPPLTAAPAITAAAAVPQPAPKPARPTLAQIAERSAWRVQVASLASQDAAEGVWTKLQSGNADLLGAIAVNVEKAEINGRGTFYRVQTQSFSERKAADDLCSSLKARNLTCIVVRTAG